MAYSNVESNQQNALNSILLQLSSLYDLSPTILTLKWLRKEQLLPEDGIVLPKHVGAIVKRKMKKYGIQCILLVTLYTFENARYKNQKSPTIMFM
jgi:hypothetical protein